MNESLGQGFELMNGGFDNLQATMTVPSVAKTVLQCYLEI